MTVNIWFCPLCGQEGANPDVRYCPVDGAIVRPVSGRSDPLIGTVVKDRYRVLGLLGSGGMADVYEVEHTDTGRRLALKVLKAEHATDDQVNDRFRQEAMLISLIAHRNVVAILDFGVLSGFAHFMVMEKLTGRTLGQMVAQKSISPHDAFSFLLQACEGMAAAHERGVIHRDLKPDNLFLHQPESTGEPVLKILDLGIGKLIANAVIPTAGTLKKGLTMAGSVFGTPAYMSPEQCQGREMTAQSDIYSLGIVLYELLFARVPFDDESYFRVFMQHIYDTPPWDQARAVELGLPDETRAVVLRAIAKNPADRQESMVELQRDISSLLSRLRHAGRHPASSRAVTSPRAAAVPTPPPLPAIRRVSLLHSSGTDDEVVELAPGAYWVGRRHGTQLECNAYLRVFSAAGRTISVLMDPGPPRDMDTVVSKVVSIIGNIENLNYIFLNHQDPDVCGNAAAIQRLAPRAFIVCSEDTWRLVRHYGFDPGLYISTESIPGSHLSFGDDQHLRFVPTPFCHFRGAVMVHDPGSGVLFSGDLFGGTTSGPGMVAIDNSFGGVAMFHEIYMPSRRALDRALLAVHRLSPEVRIIAPQHGSIITGETVDSFLQRIGQLTIGVDLMEASEKDPTALQVANEMLREYRRLAGAVSLRQLLAGFNEDHSFTNIFELREPGEIASFRVSPRLAVETLIAAMLRHVPEDIEADVFAVMTALHGRLNHPKSSPIRRY